MAVTFDTLAYAKRLKEAGFPESQAEGQTLALVEALKEGAGELATKQDIGELRHELKQDIADLRHELREVETALKADIGHLEKCSRGRFTLLQWMLGFNLVLTVAVLWFLLRQAAVF
jgi:hypothetical protein